MPSPSEVVAELTGAAAFREALDVDDASWLRARGFALEQAVGDMVVAYG